MSPILELIGGASAFGFSSAPLPPGAYESIQTVSLSSGSSTAVNFTSIPQSYKHLQIRGISRTTGAGSGFGNLRLRLNGDSGSTSYTSRQIYGSGTSSGQETFLDGSYSWTGGTTPNVSVAASVFAGTIIDILDYTNTNKFKTTRTLSGGDQNGSGIIYLIGGFWKSTAAVTSINLQVVPGNYDLAQYTHLALYGIKGAA